MFPNRVGVPKMIAFVVWQFRNSGHLRRLIELGARVLENLLGNRFRYALQRDLCARNIAGAFCHGLGHLLNVSVEAVIEHQYLRHVLVPVGPAASCRRPRY